MQATNQQAIQKMETECAKYLSFLKENKNADNKVISFAGYDIESKDAILQAFDDIQHKVMRACFGNVACEVGDVYEKNV